MGPPGQLWTRGDRRQAGVPGRGHLDPAAVTGGSALPPGRLRGAGRAFRAGPGVLGDCAGSGQCALPCRGQRPAPGHTDGGGLRDDAGPRASCLSPLGHVARFLHSPRSLREEGRQHALHGRRRPLTLLVAHVPDEETRVTRVR